MFFFSSTHNDKSHQITALEADTSLVVKMRLVLALALLLAIIVDPPNVRESGNMPWFIFLGYALYCTVITFIDNASRHLPKNKLFPWIDIIWYTAIVYFTDGVNSHFFLLYLFSIFIASFRHGLEEGVRITVASAALFIISSILVEHSHDLARLLLRTTFLIVFGYMGAYWGESILISKRRLGLLGDVSRLSNPRFGVDQTATNVLEKICEFFNADSCILVLREEESNEYSMRIVKRGLRKQRLTEDHVSREVAAPLMRFSQSRIFLYLRSSLPILGLSDSSFVYSYNQWLKYDSKKISKIANLLETRSYITVPVSLRTQYGRLYLISSHSEFKKSDALFLNQVASQAFSALETIELVDRIASDAALQERKKIACDLHDVTVQPYVGLKLGLSALRLKAQPDNPLVHDLDRLTTIADDVVEELRNYAGNFKNNPRSVEPVFVADIKRHTEKLKEFYGIQIDLLMESMPAISDRLAAEVLYLLKEGLSNIKKHTDADHGSIRIYGEQNWLKIQIENECEGSRQHLKFIPRSIRERASTLGGRVDVIAGIAGRTSVNIEIPL